MTQNQIFVIDDELMARAAMESVLSAEGFAVQTFESADTFLTQFDPDTQGCVLVDLVMPDICGLTLQSQLNALDAVAGVVFVTGHGDVSASVQAMRSGAIDFLTKPVRRNVLLGAVDSALLHSEEKSAEVRDRNEFNGRLERLTAREHEVLTHVIAGRPNKVISSELGASEQTIKVHRRRMMRKLAIGSVAELVWSAQRFGLKPAASRAELPQRVHSHGPQV